MRVLIKLDQNNINTLKTNTDHEISQTKTEQLPETIILADSRNFKIFFITIWKDIVCIYSTWN